MAVGSKVRPIWTLDMPGTAWQLLWWMICRMDENGEIRAGWRVEAAGALHRHRIWIGKSAEHLQRHGLIDTAPNRRYVRVLTGNISG